MDSDTIRMLFVYGSTAAVAILCLRSVREKNSSVIPVVGSDGLISSYVAALRFLIYSADIIEKGYHQFPASVFRVPLLYRFHYVANGSQRIKEVASAPDSVLSFSEGASDARQTLQTMYTMGPEIMGNPYHVPVIRATLTQNLTRCFPVVHEEIVHSFGEVLALKDKEWKSIHVLPNIQQIVARTSNRVFVGLPLCRDKKFIDLNIGFAVSVFTRGQIIALVPPFLRPYLGPFISSKNSSLRRGLKFLRPLINERLENERLYGSDYPDKPNDLLSWMLEVAEGKERTVPALAMRILAANMAAIHTSSVALTAALYDLTTHPEHILPLREEAERVVAEEGWTKAALGNMHKLDSFIRESQRLGSAPPLAMARKVVSKEGFTFSDGVHIPYGSFLSVSANVVHWDPENYERADVFDGFRFSNLREEHVKTQDETGDTIFNRHLISTSRDHVVWGHGRHACPGRFFAATELKSMLAHILINYDVKAETEGVRPVDELFGMIRMPNSQGRIWIRKRE
ncbi:cytochrome P450 [Mycena epipterygia]|nr:cytochrome P450 [Mycena epipterygia]